jgi:hypothetical protein
MTDENHPSQQTELSQADAQAIDALIDGKFDLSRVPANHKARAANAANLLSMLAGDCKINPTLVDLTLARVQRAGSPGHVEDLEAVLCDEDKEALDAYVAAEFRAGKVASSLRQRADQIEAMVQLVSQTGTATPATGLVDRTMRRIATTHEQNLQPIPIRSFGGFRFADLISVAAVLLMGVAVLWPILSTVKTYQQKGSCEANFGSIASAMGAYTGDNHDAFPITTASYGGNWMNVGTPDQSNSSNLFTLAKAGYTKLRDLACPGNPRAITQAPPEARDWHSLPEVSYSYYVMFGKQRPTPTNNPHTIILADKSPVIVRVATGEAIPFPDENSPNHEGKGQWALRADGTTTWLGSPMDQGDNIWLTNQQQGIWENIVKPSLAHIKVPKDVKAIVVTVTGQQPLMQGNELPETATDSFLGP